MSLATVLARLTGCLHVMNDAGTVGPSWDGLWHLLSLQLSLVFCDFTMLRLLGAHRLQ